MISKLDFPETEITVKTNILLVDDRADGLLALEAVLNSSKYNLVKARSGHEALGYLWHYCFAVILLDVQMPDLDGFETAKLIRQNPRAKETPIIFVTAINKDYRHVYQGYESGAIDYMFKPLDDYILKSKVAIFVDLFNKNLQVQQQEKLLREMQLREKDRQIAELERESLRRYINLADAIPHMVLKIDPRGKIEYFNQRWYQYTGINYEMQDTEWQLFIHPEDRRRFLATWLKNQKQSCYNFHVEMRIKRQDNIYRWHLIQVVADERDGKIIGWIGTCTDINDIKQADKELKLVVENLNKSNKELEQFAYVASHDLQEPLRIVSSYVDLFSLKYSNQLDARAQGFLTTIKDSSSRAQRLIRDLLEYARIGIKKQDFQPVDCTAILNQAISNLAIRIQEREADIIYEKLPTISVDSLQMVQLFQNLISNSIKYCDTIPKIHISVTQADKDKEWLFAIKDNGIGIDLQYNERIFVIFQRLHPMSQYEGTGIGLALCKKIVERHGGRIWIDSKPGSGTTFYFTIKA